MEEEKDYYTVEEAKEMGVPQPTLANWLYVTRVAEERYFTEQVARLVIPKAVIDRWKMHRRVREDEQL